MKPVLTVLAFIALGTVVGGWLARRFPLNTARTFCAVAAMMGSIGIVATTPNGMKAWLAMALAVVLGSDLLITLIRRLRTDHTA